LRDAIEVGFLIVIGLLDEVAMMTGSFSNLSLEVELQLASAT
jgi:hypothetical protein